MVVLAMFAALGVASFTTTAELRASALPKMLNLMQMRGDKHALTVPGELANTPPPSPSVITFTYAPTIAPTEEKSDTLPSKKESTRERKTSARGDTIFMHEDETGNTPPPSPSVIKYTYAPSNAPTEEEKDSKEGTDVSFDTTDTKKTVTTDTTDSKKTDNTDTTDTKKTVTTDTTDSKKTDNTDTTDTKKTDTTDSSDTKTTDSSDSKNHSKKTKASQRM
jgi:hypothetical protein